MGHRFITLYFGTRAQFLKMCPCSNCLLLHNCYTTVQSLSEFGCFCQCQNLFSPASEKIISPVSTGLLSKSEVKAFQPRGHVSSSTGISWSDVHQPSTFNKSLLSCSVVWKTSNSRVQQEAQRGEKLHVPGMRRVLLFNKKDAESLLGQLVNERLMT